MRDFSFFPASFLLTSLALCGCGADVPTNTESLQSTAAAREEITSARFRIEGFMKSKSGATWMSWPDAVKEALEGSNAVQEVTMRLAQDEFVIQYDKAMIDEKELVAIIKKAGYTSKVVTGDEPAITVEGDSGSRNDPIFIEALERAQKENKLLILDFYADWCAPCIKMLKTTFPDPAVAPLMEQYVFLKVDTDKHPELAKSFKVAGLPDIRFLDQDGNELRKLLNFQDAKTFAQVLQEVLAQGSDPKKGDEKWEDFQRPV